MASSTAIYLWHKLKLYPLYGVAFILGLSGTLYFAHSKRTPASQNIENFDFASYLHYEGSGPEAAG